MASRGIQRILINLNGDSSLINNKIMNYINNSGLIIIIKSLGQFMFFFLCKYYSLLFEFFIHYIIWISKPKKKTRNLFNGLYFGFVID